MVDTTVFANRVLVPSVPPVRVRVPASSVAVVPVRVVSVSTTSPPITVE